MGLSISNHLNRDELEATADLLIHYADIIGTENGIRGTFIRAVCIPTNGQTRAQKQHPVAQALEPDIDAEIKRMATEGIIESCTNPRGFKSPVFAVHKKNGSVRQFQKNSQQGSCKSRPIPNASDRTLIQQDWRRQQIFRIT